MGTAVLSKFRRIFALRSNPACLAFCLLAGGLAGFLTSAPSMSAQTAAGTNPAQIVPAKKPVHHVHKPVKPVVPEPAPVVPVVPPPEQPKWPVNDAAGPASVVLDSTGLRIDASNSSLQAILKEVSTETGVKVEGLSSDERIYGVYGPGRPRDVLTQLLNGSAYNVLMIGDQGQGSPRELVLTARQTGPAQPAPRNNVNNDEDDVEEPPAVVEPPQPNISQPKGPPGAPNGGPPRTPQQIMQEMQQRQQQVNPPQN